MKLSNSIQFVLFALALLYSGSTADARLSGRRSHQTDLERDLSVNNTYELYAYNPCGQEIFADFDFLGSGNTVHVNHGNCKKIGEVDRSKKISYVDYTKTGSSKDNDDLKVKNAYLHTIWDTKSECGFDGCYVPENIKVVYLECPK